MMKNLLLIILAVAAGPVYAYDLSEYPDFFVEDGSLDLYIVVGDKAPATHVIAQTQIALSLSKLADSQPKINKLASEIYDIDDFNLISIGSACDNEISALILDEQCSESKRTAIELFDGNKLHIVLDAFNDEGIKKLAYVLSNYEDFDLEGFEYKIEAAEDDKMQNDADAEIGLDAGESDDSKEKTEYEAEIGRTGAEKQIIDEETETINNNESGANEQGENKVDVKQSFLKQIVSWLVGLFR